MWDSRLGRINVAKHFIKLEPIDQRPVDSTPYRARLKEENFRKQEVD